MSLKPAETAELSQLLAAIVAAYAKAPDRALKNDQLYRDLASTNDLKVTKPVGKSCALHSPLKRAIRWRQQTLKQLGLLERVPGERGVWRCKASTNLTPAAPSLSLLAYSTHLGLAIWGDNKHFFRGFSEKIACVVTSPPYPLQRSRAYGGPTEAQFVDFICETFEPLVRNLLPGGSIAINISNDIFIQGTPARSMYVERLTLALHDRLGLHLMDKIVWANPCKPPGPTQWASRTRQQLNSGYEPVLWMTNQPKACFASNQRVLVPHSEKHAKLLARGGENRSAVYGDGAYSVKPGSFGNITAGTIARNVLRFPSGGRSNHDMRAKVKAASLPMHGALMPLGLAKFLVEFLTQPDAQHLVVDPFAGWNRTGLAAELLGRPWVSTELMAQYAAGGSYDFVDCAGYTPHFEIVGADDLEKATP